MIIWRWTKQLLLPTEAAIIEMFPDLDLSQIFLNHIDFLVYITQCNFLYINNIYHSHEETLEYYCQPNPTP